jgi:hypothetical protein
MRKVPYFRDIQRPLNRDAQVLVYPVPIHRQWDYVRSHYSLNLRDPYHSLVSSVFGSSKFLSGRRVSLRQAQGKLLDP